jgi:hypothetical protein
MSFDFDNLILLIGTNPLPNFVVADYFLQNNPNIRTIWLIHSEENKWQAGTSEQADNLERVLRKKWKDHPNLQFPLEKVSVSDVSDAQKIQADIKNRMMERLKKSQGFHFNYTGGTKSMSTHIYWVLKELEGVKPKSFSYLDARNFRLVEDYKGVLVEGLRDKISIEFEDLIALHGFDRCNFGKRSKDKEINFSEAQEIFRVFKTDNKKPQSEDGKWFEVYVTGMLKANLDKNVKVLENWQILKPGWDPHANFELDVILLYGYQLTGISCTTSKDLHKCKTKGFEIIQRTNQIGGDEAKAVLIIWLEKSKKDILQPILSTPYAEEI